MDGGTNGGRRLPLAGVRVVDLTLVWAGPHCTQLLAEWGAEVIRVEPLTHIQPSTRGAEQRFTKESLAALPDQGRALVYHYPDNDPGPHPWNTCAEFNSHARNKRSVTLDTWTAEGKELFRRLIAVSDVFVENNAPETIERSGLTYEVLRTANPGLIMLRMPAYGLSGPYKNVRSFGSHMEAMTGHHYLRGYPDMDPSATGPSFAADAAGGVVGAFAVMLALRARRRTGRGQQIELPQAENFLPYMGDIILDYTMNGRSAEPHGNDHPSHAPHGPYPCRGDDRWIAIDVWTDAAWESLCRVLNAPEWRTHPRFVTALSRWQHRRELDALLAERTRAWSVRELFQALQAEGVTAGPVQDERDAYACPHLNARGFFEELDHPEAGRQSYPGLNLRMAGTPNHLRRHPVMLGEDNEYVYRDVLGLSEAEYDALVDSGQVGTEYADELLGRKPG